MEQEWARAGAEWRAERLRRGEERRVDILQVAREKFAMWNNDRPHFEVLQPYRYEYSRMSAEDFQEERFLFALMD